MQTYEGIGGYFNSFLTRYPSPDQRLRAATRLMQDQIENGIGEYRSRMQLVARWGHDNDQLHPIAENMYSLKSKLGRNAGQLVLSFVKGSLADLCEAEGGLDNEVVIRVGKLRDGELIHCVGPSRRRAAEQPPLLLHAMGIGVTSLVKIEADIVGRPLVDRIADEGVLPVWRGASPVTEDVDAYWAEAHTTEHDVVVGDVFCLSVIGQLDQLTGQNGMLERHIRGFATAA